MASPLTLVDRRYIPYIAPSESVPSSAPYYLGAQDPETNRVLYRDLTHIDLCERDRLLQFIDAMSRKSNGAFLGKKEGKADIAWLLNPDNRAMISTLIDAERLEVLGGYDEVFSEENLLSLYGPRWCMHEETAAAVFALREGLMKLLHKNGVVGDALQSTYTGLANSVYSQWAYLNTQARLLGGFEILVADLKALDSATEVAFVRDKPNVIERYATITLHGKPARVLMRIYVPAKGTIKSDTAFTVLGQGYADSIAGMDEMGRSLAKQGQLAVAFSYPTFYGSDAHVTQVGDKDCRGVGGGCDSIMELVPAIAAVIRESEEVQEAVEGERAAKGATASMKIKFAMQSASNYIFDCLLTALADIGLDDAARAEKFASYRNRMTQLGDPFNPIVRSEIARMEQSLELYRATLADAHMQWLALALIGERKRYSAIELVRIDPMRGLSETGLLEVFGLIARQPLKLDESYLQAFAQSELIKKTIFTNPKPEFNVSQEVRHSFFAGLRRSVVQEAVAYMYESRYDLFRAKAQAQTFMLEHGVRQVVIGTACDQIVSSDILIKDATLDKRAGIDTTLIFYNNKSGAFWRDHTRDKGDFEGAKFGPIAWLRYNRELREFEDTGAALYLINGRSGHMSHADQPAHVRWALFEILK